MKLTHDDLSEGMRLYIEVATMKKEMGYKSCNAADLPDSIGGFPDWPFVRTKLNRWLMEHAGDLIRAAHYGIPRHSTKSDK